MVNDTLVELLTYIGTDDSCEALIQSVINRCCRVTVKKGVSYDVFCRYSRTARVFSRILDLHAHKKDDEMRSMIMCLLDESERYLEARTLEEQDAIFKTMLGTLA